jgi:uncharacterized protein (TIGR02145 family)
LDGPAIFDCFETMKEKTLALAILACVALAACKKIAPCNSTVYRGSVLNPATVTDYDGNVYNVVKIGNQNWLQQNLKAAHYQSGALITADSVHGLDSVNWYNTYIFDAAQPAWCYYSNDTGKNHVFGKLYNWYAVSNGNMCPVGYHVPSDAEWHQLLLTLDGCAILADPASATAGSQLKATTIWTRGDTTGTNTSLFTAYPAGACDPTHTFNGLDSLSYFWTSTSRDSANAWDYKLNSADSSVDRFAGDMHNGFSVRCVGN